MRLTLDGAYVVQRYIRIRTGCDPGRPTHHASRFPVNAELAVRLSREECPVPVVTSFNASVWAT